MKRRLRWAILSATVLTLALPLAAQQLDASNWGKGTPGVTLITHEGPRQHTSNGTVLWYNLIGKGFPEGVVYNLWRWPTEKSPDVMIKGVSFDKRGVLVCSGKPGYCAGQGTDDPVNIKATAALGEMKRMAVVSEDGKIAAFVDAVPFPLEASDKGCKLSIVRKSLLADSVIASASGLKPNQSLTVTTRFGDEGGTTKATSSPEGTWTQVLAGQSAKQSKGKAFVSVSDAVCAASVTFDYGPGSNKPQ